MHDDDGAAGIQGGGGIAGIGYVSGIRCIVSANDSAIKGGTFDPDGREEASARASRSRCENKLPMVQLVESGGANLLYQAEMFVEGGRGFANQARLSAAGIPQITVVHGSSTAGGAYLPGLSDYVILVRGRAKVFLAGPPLLRAATGEIATDEELGGADMHATISGLGEYLAEDDADGIRIAREIMAKLPWNEQLPAAPQKSFKEPRYAAEELAGVVPADYRKPYDVREVIARIVDDSDFLDFKTLLRPTYGLRPRRDRRSRCRLDRQQRADRRRRRQQGGTIHSALLPGQHADRLSAEHDRLHGRARSRAEPASSSTAPR